VPEDPGVFTDVFQFGRDLAPINGLPPHHCFNGLVDAADWLTRTLGVQGFRLDNTKGVSTIFMSALLNHGALAGKFAVGEFADGNIGLMQQWMNAVQHRSSLFDFPLHFLLKSMCNDPGSMDMASLDHAGLAGFDPLGAVTFVENHDTDRGGVGGPIVRNKALAYAYILTSEGYPCVFYRDYSTDRNCFGLKPQIDKLIWIHEHLAAGGTQQRWKDLGVFAFERLGSSHLLVGLNKDSNSRTITVQTGFPAHTELQDFAGHAPNVTTDAKSMVTILIPPNENGLGYVCYARKAISGPFTVHSHAVTQDYEGASDLDIRPATENEQVQVCRIFVESNSDVEARLFFDGSHWAQTTSIQLNVVGPDAKPAAGKKYGQNAQGAALQFRPTLKGFYTFVVQAANTPAQNAAPTYKLRLTYTAPQMP
jgi:alpha-amylase